MNKDVKRRCASRRRESRANGICSGPEVFLWEVSAHRYSRLHFHHVGPILTLWSPILISRGPHSHLIGSHSHLMRPPTRRSPSFRLVSSGCYEQPLVLPHVPHR